MQDVGWLKSITKLPIVVKGILTREDGKIKWLLMLCSFLHFPYCCFHGYKEPFNCYTIKSSGLQPLDEKGNYFPSLCFIC